MSKLLKIQKINIFEYQKKKRDITFSKKSQMWYMDFIIGLTIFTMILILSFRYMGDDYIIQTRDKQSLVHTSKLFSESLMSEGIPQNWTEATVTNPGILSNNKLNLTKLELLNNITLNNYDYIRSLFELKSEFLFYFTDTNDNIINLTNYTYYGKQGYTKTDIFNLDVEERIQVKRYLVNSYNNISEIISMEIVMWEE